MKLRICLFAALLVGTLFSRFAQAEEVEPQKISFQRGLPKSVTASTPRGAKSYFWGTFKLKNASPLYGIHLFKRNPRQGQVEVGDIGSDQKFTLDVYTNHRKTFKRINRVSVNYSSQIWAPNLIDVRLLWLDQLETKPILKLRIYDPNGYIGPIGDEIAVTFFQGLTKSASVQSWDWGATSIGGQDNIWTTRDNEGNLRVIANISVMFETSPEVWVWKKNRFEVAEGTDNPAETENKS